MKEIVGDLWRHHFGPGHSWTIITTNGFVKEKERVPGTKQFKPACVMGRGVAAQAKRRFKELPFKLGARILESGNHVYKWPEYGIITFPVKDFWWNEARLSIIIQSIYEMLALLDGDSLPVYGVRFGCGNGGLAWPAVKAVVEPLLDDQYTIVDLGDNHIPRLRRRTEVLPFTESEISSIETEAWTANPGGRYWTDFDMLRAVVTIRQLQLNQRGAIVLPAAEQLRAAKTQKSGLQPQLFTM